MDKYKGYFEQIANLLYKEDGHYEGVVCFDHKSYDYEFDIPYLIIDGDKKLIDEFRINHDATEIVVISGYDMFTLFIPTCTFTDDDFDKMGMLDLLRNVFYETEYSWQIGDFEDDFLNLK